jgi:hypothetical protein
LFEDDVLFGEDVCSALLWGFSAELDPTLYVCPRRKQASATTSTHTYAVFRNLGAELKGSPSDQSIPTLFRFGNGLRRWLTSVLLMGEYLIGE